MDRKLRKEFLQIVNKDTKKMFDITHTGKDKKHLEPSYFAGKNEKWLPTLENSSLTARNIPLSYDLAIPLLGIYSIEKLIHKPSHKCL